MTGDCQRRDERVGAEVARGVSDELTWVLLFVELGCGIFNVW
jgi:hypothetical protein